MVSMRCHSALSVVFAVITLGVSFPCATSFAITSHSTKPLPSSSNPSLGWRASRSNIDRRMSTVAETTEFMQDLREELSRNEEAQMMMDALRGKNVNDDASAVEGLEMALVDVDVGRRVNDADDVLPFDYDPAALRRFFRRRPLAVLTRITQVASVGIGLALRLALDKVLGVDDKDVEAQRAAELRETITRLGPFFIKLGQALSIRPDILSPRSMVELQKLCDKVPGFDSTIAFATIESELGRPVNEIFSEITDEPVAAASLGQVYRATLRSTGEIVAVKVQRPRVLETVSLDLYLARELGTLARTFPALVQRLDAVALLDEFAYRFYQELDYVLECANGETIRDQMASLPDVVIPRNYPDYTSRRVHVAEWIDGEKLSQSTNDDVGALVNLGVITYLTQLLEHGFFHADPHPGNMMRTTDGKLAILDFGLMTEITDDQKYGMIEAIAHLLNRDYTEIGQDFVNLDFIPRGTDTGPIVPALTKVFDVALAGGGAKSINFQELAADLAEITFEYPFRIPPYFALVIRAISVLEGIALVGNPNFAIIDEAYPYIARRLMTDKSERLRAALRYMVYGRDGTVIDAERVIDLLQALEKFTGIKERGDGTAFKVDGVRGRRVVGRAGDFRGSQAVNAGGNGGDDDETELSLTVESTTLTPEERDENTAREALKFFFGPDGDVFREFMLEEIVTVVDATGRGAIQQLIDGLGLSNLPVPGLFRALNPEPSAADKEVIEQIQKLLRFLLGDFEGAMGSSSDNSASTARLRRLLPVVREYSPQLYEYGSLLIVRLSEKAIARGLNYWAKGAEQPERRGLAVGRT